ncbi:single-stranded DNA-binding protein [Rothia sp. (in: high G+C Gram-positive bacteria)]|uniref:single-stranded DNA-binding protein n=1 Tax=Rothia sp. (in: high G+C Gram-positive bacteria) TaxID=1885016 RepID=UPI001CB09148|nr:single-stranded DNA-binding protein [Rothia sp. (in: high G+C Gram-positive bacteria)]MBF1680454.1 single-stranded DNA-binding protein [Rothia sp. (in: high G+C Gram-positive bacteria)]
MSDTILIRGFTASDPALSTLPNGVPVVNFRLASTPRWQDATGTWKEGTTNWYTVKAYRRLAQNIATSIEKGQPLVVSGRQRISRWNREDGTQGTTVEVDALGIGHDLNYGTSTFARTVEKRTVNEGAMQGAPLQNSVPQNPAQQDAPQYTQHYAPAHAPQQNMEASGVTAPGASVQNGGAQSGVSQSDEPPF